VRAFKLLQTEACGADSSAQKKRCLVNVANIPVQKIHNLPKQGGNVSKQHSSRET
jgi:hypothetical protein